MWLTALALAGDCQLNVPYDAAFSTQLPAVGEGVHLVVELWVDEASIGATEALLDTLQARELTGTIVVGKAFAESNISKVLREWDKRGHRIVARFDPSDELGVPMHKVRLSVDEWWEAFRKTNRRVKRGAGRLPRAIAVPTLTRRAEAGSRQAGIPAVLELQGPPGSTPRLIEPIDSYPGFGVLLPQGTYSGACGPSPVVTRLTPAALDRAAGALNAAMAAGAPGVVQLGVQVQGTTADDAVALGRWLDTIVLPSGIAVSDPVEVAGSVWELLRPRGVSGKVQIVPTTEGGRLVSLTELTTAARTMAGLDTIPRLLPGELTPTEAFLGWTELLAGTVEGDVVRLGPLAGPVANASSVLAGPVTLPRAEVVAMAVALQTAMGDEVPAALPIAGQLLTAGELFTAFASAVDGDEPVLARPVTPPDPHNPGLGWGDSG